MRILAIDTSCDDTCIAVLDDKNILSNIVSSQVDIHKEYGGVYPMLAKREHQKNLVPVLEKALKGMIKKQNKKVDDSKLKNILIREQVLYKELIRFLSKHTRPDIHRIAVTIGPGLEPCLWVGINFAKALSYYWHIPIVPVNHIEGHILACLSKNPKFPAIALIVSGGHTQLILVKKIGKYRIIGETRDDAAGECFDKTARILGLAYPGGPEISKLAKQKTKTVVSLPRPMINTNDYDFSFSGLKTAVLYKGKQDKIAMAKEIEQAIVDVLVKKTVRACKQYKAKSVILGGGVASNDRLRKALDWVVPDKELCTDNAVMIGLAGYYGKPKKTISAQANLRL